MFFHQKVIWLLSTGLNPKLCHLSLERSELLLPAHSLSSNCKQNPAWSKGQVAKHCNRGQAASNLRWQLISEHYSSCPVCSSWTLLTSSQHQLLIRNAEEMSTTRLEVQNPPSSCYREKQNLTPRGICFFYFHLCFPLFLFTDRILPIHNGLPQGTLPPDWNALIQEDILTLSKGE